MTTSIAKFTLSLVLTLSMLSLAGTAEAYWHRGYYHGNGYYHHRGYWNGGYYYAYPANYGGGCRNYGGYYDQFGRWHRPYRACW